MIEKSIVELDKVFTDFAVYSLAMFFITPCVYTLLVCWFVPVIPPQLFCTTALYLKPFKSHTRVTLFAFMFTYFFSVLINCYFIYKNRIFFSYFIRLLHKQNN